MLLDSHKYSLCKSHKLPWALLQIQLIISYILSNLDLPQKYLLQPNWATKLYYHHKRGQSHLPCGKNQKGLTKHSLKSPLLHDTSKARCYTALKACCYTTPLNARCYTAPKSRCYIAPLKACCYTIPLKARCYTTIFL